MTREVRVVGLDPSWTSFGIAYPDGHLGRVRTTPAIDDDMRLEVLTAAAVGAAVDADLAVIEGYSYGSKQARERLGYLGETLRSKLRKIGTPYIDVAPTTLKMFATGRGNATKSEMRQAAHEILGIDEAVSHDEADAAWLREIGLVLTGQSKRLRPSKNAQAIADLELPEEMK